MTEGPGIRATRDQILEFKESILWKDIKREMGIWKRQFEKDVLGLPDRAKEANASTAAVLLDIGEKSGIVKAVYYFLSLPDTLLNILEGQKDDGPS